MFKDYHDFLSRDAYNSVFHYVIHVALLFAVYGQSMIKIILIVNPDLPEKGERLHVSFLLSPLQYVYYDPTRWKTSRQEWLIM